MPFGFPSTLDLADPNSPMACLASGGVDSSVAIALLCERGFKPDLFYIRIGMEDEEGGIHCTAQEDIELVSFLARQYGLHWEEIDLHRAYWDSVVTYTIESVKKGYTPNPDVMCNKLIKFGVFDEQVGHRYRYIATGHYASTLVKDRKVFLATSPDPVKDQTDFLAQLSYPQLQKIVFPVGELHKQEVRDLAERLQLINAHRKDSQGICFLGQISYNDFIKRYLGTCPGRIVEFESGKILGTHNGFWFHTIGQRKGLGLSGGPWYVVDKDIDQNIVYVSGGYDPEAQYGTEIYLSHLHFITESIWPEGTAETPVEVTFKIRHTPEFTRGTLIPQPTGGYLLQSQAPIQGIAPGQFAVLYDIQHQICYGSGAIAFAPRKQP